MSQHHFVENLSTGQSDEPNINIGPRWSTVRVVKLLIWLKKTDVCGFWGIHCFCIKRWSGNWPRWTIPESESPKVRILWRKGSTYGATAALTGLFCDIHRTFRVVASLRALCRRIFLAIPREAIIRGREGEGEMAWWTVGKRTIAKIFNSEMGSVKIERCDWPIHIDSSSLANRR